MKFTLCLIFAVLTNVTVAQDLLLMRDGKHIRYKKLKYEEGYFELTCEDKRKIKVPKDDVTGFYDSHLQKVTYKKPVVADNENSGTSSVKNDTVNHFQTLERKWLAKSFFIKKNLQRVFAIMERIFTPPLLTITRKGDEFKNVWTLAWGAKKMTLFHQNRLCMMSRLSCKKLKAVTLMLKKNMLKIISAYNLKNFAKPSATDYRNLGTVSFYTSVGPKLKETIRLSVNDSIEYTMPKTHYPLAVSFP